MSQLIKFRRGLKADLPAAAELGEPLFATDTAELYIGTGSGRVLVTGEDKHVKVGASGTADYLNENYFEQDGTNHIRILQNTVLTGVNADKVDGKNVDDAQNTTSYLWTAGKTKSYADSLIQGLDWQNSVVDTSTAPPVSPNDGDRYLVKATATGDFAGQENKIAVYDLATTSWSFITPNEGFAIWDETANIQKVYNGAAWVTFGSTTTHNNTSGLQGGTTNQYYHLTSTQHGDLTSGGNADTQHIHNTDNLTEGTVNLFYTDGAAVDAVGNAFTTTDSIAVTYAAGAISFDLKKQNTNSITLAIPDASGLSATLKIQDTDAITLAVPDTNGVAATLVTQSSDSVTLTVNASGLKADVNVDDSSIKIDATNNWIYVATVDGGTFA